jgi:mannose-1-phosphate guanylyltransferase/phosphomannomutase
VCEIDLTAAVGFHRARRSAVTLVLYRHPNPLEYGLVLTDGEGRVERFVEKPSWSQVIASTVNTGIYVMTARAMGMVPEHTCYDFGKELFPKLLAGGELLYGYITDGYWRDMGDCPAYLDSVADVLSGKAELDLELPQIAPGVWSASAVPQDVTLVPPCWIGERAVIEPGCLIGPHTVIGGGSSVGRGSLVQRSVLQQARVGERATLYGAILCPNASARKGSVLGEGTVLGEDSVAEENSVLMEGVKLWPGRHAPRGSRLTVSLTGPGWTHPPAFGDGGVLQGVISEDLTAQLLLQIGSALGSEGKAGLGWAGGDGAAMLARAAGAGIASAGTAVLASDAPSAAAAAWLAERYELPVFLFIEQAKETAYVSCFDRRGLPLDRGRQRRLEGAVLRGESVRVPGSRVGRWEPIIGCFSAYTVDAANRSWPERARLKPVTVSVTGGGACARILAQALELLGCKVLREKCPGTPAFAADRGGRRLLAWDENGTALTPETVLAILCLVELENGEGKLALPPWVPSVIETMAAVHGQRVLRLGRDGAEAEELYRSLPWLRDAAFGACRICGRLSAREETLQTLAGNIPRFALHRREISLRGSRGAVMEALAEEHPESAGEGLRVRMGDGWVYISPLSRRSALRVVGEGQSAEMAAELCDFYAKKVRKLDRTGPQE